MKHVSPRTRGFLHKLGVGGVVIFCAAAVGISLAWAATTASTATNVSCATATASLPGHTVGVDGTAVDTIAGTSTAASHCNTVTYTIPTSTVTTTVTAPASSSSSTTSASSTASSSTSSTSSTTSRPTSGGNGTLVFDGTFSATDPSAGPNWTSIWGNCYTYINPSELEFGPFDVSTCNGNPSGSGGRTDVSTQTSPNPQSAPGLIYHKGTAYCTSIPFYLPRQLPTSLQSGAHVGIAEMKDSSSSAPDWSIQLVTPGGQSQLGFQSGASSTIYRSGSPVAAGVWHTASICQDAAGTSASVYEDGVFLASKSGLNMYYDGYANQPLDINFYTSGAPWNAYQVIHGDPLIATQGSNGLPPEPSGGWESP